MNKFGFKIIQISLITLMLFTPMTTYALADYHNAYDYTEEKEEDNQEQIIQKIETVTDLINGSLVTIKDLERIMKKDFEKVLQLSENQKKSQENKQAFEMTETQLSEALNIINTLHKYIAAIENIAGTVSDDGWVELKVDELIQIYEKSLLLIPELESEIVIESSVAIIEALEKGHNSNRINKSKLIKKRIESIGIAASRSLGLIDPKKEIKVEINKTIIDVDAASLVLNIQNTAREFERIENRVNAYYGEENVRDLWFEITLEAERQTDTVVMPIQKEVLDSIKATPVSRIGLETDGITLAIHKLDLSNEKDVELEIKFESSKEKAKLPEDAFEQGYVVDVKYFIENEEKKTLVRPALISFNLEKFNFGEPVKPDELSVYKFDEETGLWNPVPGTYDPITNELSANRLQLSQYTIMKSNRLFSDIANSWAETEITALLNKGVINEQTLFKPSENVSRKEFAAWVTRSYGLVSSEEAHAFTDINVGDVFSSEIAAGIEAGLLTGRSETSFDPDGNVTREEFAVIVGTALIRYEQKILNDNNTSALDVFADSDLIDIESKDYLALMIELDLLPVENNTVNPKGIVSKELAASILNKILS